MTDDATHIRRDAEEWDSLVRAAERSGDYLGAYDLAGSGLAQHPDDLTLRYRAVLNLSRSGANSQAATMFARYRLDQSSEERVMALGARLLREAAFARSGPGAQDLLRKAARRYGELYARTGRTFPGVNAATLHLLAGNAASARRVAKKVLTTRLDAAVNTYEDAADAAAAALIIGDIPTAEDFIRQCGELHGGNFAAVASTRRQLGRICERLGLDSELFARLRSKPVIHYAGHMIGLPGQAARFPAEAEARVAHEIERLLAARDVGLGFGSLACGADVLIAEALLKRNADLHVVLPFEVSEFKTHSVVPGGEAWVRRFDACLARASSISYATEDGYLGDHILFGHCSRIAMGLSLLRGAHLDAEVFQLAVWDGACGPAGAGTAADIAYWKNRGLATEIIDSGANYRPGGLPPDALAALSPPGASRRRVIRAMLFGDFFGFAKLLEQQISRFVDVVLGDMSRILNRYADRLDFRNTWGDGLYLVMDDVASAMSCALDLQAAIGALDLAATGLPAELGLRIGGHVGPVFPVTDPILGSQNFMGSHVSRTARIEPVTPEGQVYVTEAFAALLALDRDPSLTCEYVGIVPAAKNYGSFRMYVVKRR